MLASEVKTPAMLPLVFLLSFSSKAVSKPSSTHFFWHKSTIFAVQALDHCKFACDVALRTARSKLTFVLLVRPWSKSIHMELHCGQSKPVSGEVVLRAHEFEFGGPNIFFQ